MGNGKRTVSCTCRALFPILQSRFPIPCSQVPSRPAIQRHEWFAVAVSATYFFLVLAAYYVIRPVRDQLTAAVGSTALPIFYAATFVATLSLAPLFGALVARYQRRHFV